MIDIVDLRSDTVTKPTEAMYARMASAPIGDDGLDGDPTARELEAVAAEALGEFAMWIKDRKNRRAIPHRLETCGYVPVRNDTAESGLWLINKVRQVIYAKSDLSIRDRLRAARNLVSPPTGYEH